MARTANPNIRIDLLRAAEYVFGQRGVDGAKVEEITARAGVSKGAFYLHFQSKEDVFRALVESMVARLAQVLLDYPRPSAAAGPAEYLERWIEQDVVVFEILWQNRSVGRLLLEGGKSAAFSHLIDEFAERARHNIKASLEEGKRLGYFRDDLDVELTSLVLSGAYDRVARHLTRLSRRPDLESWLRTIQATLLTGVAGKAVTAILDHKVNNRRPRASTKRSA